jgi:threonyl-tRNA synthetase
MYDQMNVENELYQLRPMNCPQHILLFKRKLHSYKGFPIRVAELGTVYRYELSGSLHGLFCVRGFTQVSNQLYKYINKRSHLITISSPCVFLLEDAHVLLCLWCVHV